MMELKKTIEDTWNKRELLKSKKSIDCINTVIEEIDKGRLRIAEKIDDKWQVNNWLKKAVILYFPIRKMETIEIGPLEFHDKMKLKNDYANLGVRVVPHAIARYGSYLSKGVIMMCSKDNYYQEFIIQGLEMKKYMHQWLKRIDQYYEEKRPKN